MSQYPVTIVAIRGESEPYLVVDSKIESDFSTLNIPIAKNEQDILQNPVAVLWSWVASPARYLEAALKQASDHLHGKTDNFFILNPIVHIKSHHWPIILAKIKEIPPHCCAVISSSNDLPIGILIPQEWTAELLNHNLLRFLSCTSGSLDATVLASSVKVNLMHLCQEFQLTSSRGMFCTPDYLTIYKLIATHYIRMKGATHKNPPEYIAIMPYHAGDVLFFCLAFRDTKHPYTAIMVHEGFADIVRKILPETKIYLAKTDAISRGSNKLPHNKPHQNSETLHFMEEIYPYIPENAAFYFFRLMSGAGMFHLIDHAKFAISDDTFVLVKNQYNDVVASQKVEKDPTKLLEKSVYIHFDAGWPLKIYPHHYQLELIELLQKAGYRVSVLSDTLDALPVNKVPFTSLASLEKAIQSHTLFLGMDSFPAHFATHILQQPTILLFSSTAKWVASGVQGIHYMDLENHLACSPCDGMALCPLYQIDYCHNFSAPEKVFAAIEQMYHQIHGLAPDSSGAFSLKEKKIEALSNINNIARATEVIFHTIKPPVLESIISVVDTVEAEKRRLFMLSMRQKFMWVFSKMPLVVLRAIHAILVPCHKIKNVAREEIERRASTTDILS